MDLETGDTNRVSPGIGKTTCAWIHPNGKKVMFSSSHSDPNAKAKQADEIEERKVEESENIHGTMMRTMKFGKLLPMALIPLI